MRRAERLFRLVSELRRRGVTRARDLAEHLEISTRSVYRDIAHLQASGLPIDGEAGVGYVLRPGFDLPAMTFTFEQLDALAMGLAFVDAAGDPALAAAAREVRAKVQAGLPDPAEQRLMEAPLFATRRDGRAAEVAEPVRRAIRERGVIRIRYRNDAGDLSDRRVRPLAIWAFTEGWLFVAWCELRTDFRTFRLDRIDALTDTGERFEDHPGRDLRAYLAAKMPELLTPRSPRV
jgi:predicted DNA-binding transcriptional regulator YafY